ncbi:phosphomannomutase [Gracilibacillus halophilus YIM-C55.5]|uniref:Phosphoglucomutase n=1 Tax=Gracilibacillus halophilus YIM-C55.5 TaxID=1308866 RepID=N4WX76_9BACI|nr:phospho-sugar mutase [Gracilibacillus halophilus]ENH97676.1 phosphomannomutase [Gracilibacillus halophilus YIM-C55.5]
MSWQDQWKKWSNFHQLDESLKKQLTTMEQDKAQLEDAFYQSLTFGTGGMRGELGPGTNRMNIYTIRKAVEGLANYIEKHVDQAKTRGVVIAYDSRYMSKEFAIESARVLGQHQIQAYVFESLRPTPLLSFAVRYLQTAAGIMITASHNPPEYNGFKVYNEDGGQIPPKEAEAIIEEVNRVEDELQIDVQPQDEIEADGLLKWVGNDIDEAYLKELQSIQKTNVNEQHSHPLKIVFTPLHGTAYDLVVRGLKQTGFERLEIVDEQAKPDPEFSTVSSPNPEEHQAFEMAMKQGKEIDADILIGTDPDADRLGVAVKDGDGSYQVLTGNQLGTLLLDYTLAHMNETDRQNGKVIKTIVTTEMGRAVAEHYGVETIDTLTGFKFIGEKMKQFESTEDHFLFGYEESYGYLIGDFVRDKDAVQCAIAACEMADYWKRQGKTLKQALTSLYEKHGYYLEKMKSLTLKGINGAEQIAKIMNNIREYPFETLANQKVFAVEDYASSQRLYTQSKNKETIQLPKENVVKFLLEDEGWVCFRPSGTEPKMKSYFGVKTNDQAKSESFIQQIQEEVEQRMEEVLGEQV